MLLQVTCKLLRRRCHLRLFVSPQGAKKNRANDDNNADRDGPRGKEWHRQRKGARGAICRPKNRPAGPGFAVGVYTDRRFKLKSPLLTLKRATLTKTTRVAIRLPSDRHCQYNAPNTRGAHRGRPVPGVVARRHVPKALADVHSRDSPSRTYASQRISY